MSDRVAWIRAQLDATAAAARLVPQPYRLYVSDQGRLAEPLADDDGRYAQWADGEDRMPNHINNWELVYDPAAVLADVEAKRALLDSHYDYGGVCPRCFDWQNKPVQREPFPCEVVRLLAEGFRHRPGYAEACGE